MNAAEKKDNKKVIIVGESIVKSLRNLLYKFFKFSISLKFL